MSAQHRQSGTAIITALLVVALASIVATELIARTSLDIRRTENTLLNDQAYLLALGMEAWAMQVLVKDRQDNEYDHLDEPWAGTLEPASLDAGDIGGKIVDLNARFNLNNLVDDNGKQSKADVEGFRRLLDALEIEADLASRVVDWIDSNINETLPNGAEDNAYLDASPPYRVANNKMVSASELLLIKGFTQEHYKKLQPYIAALPERTKVNINTASAPVLIASIPELSLDEAQGIIDDRPEQGYADVNAFRGLQAFEGRSVNNIDVKSDYFLIASFSQNGRSVVRLNTLIQRGEDEKLPVRILMRSRGEI